jgi:hypothetical protein
LTTLNVGMPFLSQSSKVGWWVAIMRLPRKTQPVEGLGVNHFAMACQGVAGWT